MPEIGTTNTSPGEGATLNHGETLLGGDRCPACQTPAASDANYCQKCGLALAGGLLPRRRSVGFLLILCVIAIPIVVVVGGATLFISENNKTAKLGNESGLSINSESGQGNITPPDISSLTPRQAADRLFNRVMSANEHNNLEEALRFAPMAIAAYNRVTDLDADAHYHAGLIYLVLGDLENAERKSRLIKRLVPNHLLALGLEHTVATRRNDREMIALVEAEFLMAYENERNSRRPEYVAHKNSIEQLRDAVRATAVRALGPEPAPQ